MASKRARTTQNRRDRRKAKQSGWLREGRGNPKKAAHGGSGATQNASYDASTGYTPSKLVGGTGVPRKPLPKAVKNKAPKKASRKPRDHSIPHGTLSEIVQMLAEDRLQQVESPAVE